MTLSQHEKMKKSCLFILCRGKTCSYIRPNNDFQCGNFFYGFQCLNTNTKTMFVCLFKFHYSNRKIMVFILIDRYLISDRNKICRCRFSTNAILLVQIKQNWSSCIVICYPLSWSNQFPARVSTGARVLVSTTKIQNIPWNFWKLCIHCWRAISLLFLFVLFHIHIFNGSNSFPGEHVLFSVAHRRVNFWNCGRKLNFKICVRSSMSQ